MWKTARVERVDQLLADADRSAQLDDIWKRWEFGEQGGTLENMEHIIPYGMDPRTADYEQYLTGLREGKNLVYAANAYGRLEEAQAGARKNWNKFKVYNQVRWGTGDELKARWI